MTKLRDDGYLETDNPVVVACFIDKGWGVRGNDLDGRRCTGEIAGVDALSAMLGGSYHVIRYPILIPASVVAEVYYQGGVERTVIWDATGRDWMAVSDWFDQHTGGSDDQAD